MQRKTGRKRGLYNFYRLFLVKSVVSRDFCLGHLILREKKKKEEKKIAWNITPISMAAEETNAKSIPISRKMPTKKLTHMGGTSMSLIIGEYPLPPGIEGGANWGRVRRTKNY